MILEIICEMDRKEAAEEEEMGFLSKVRLIFQQICFGSRFISHVISTSQCVLQLQHLLYQTILFFRFIWTQIRI